MPKPTPPQTPTRKAPAPATPAPVQREIPPAASSPTLADPELPHRLASLRDRIAAACAKARRDPADITLIAVTKAASLDQVRHAVALGLTNLGENRVPQLTQRAATLAAEPSAAKLKWHMIGHLQRNKVKPLLPFVTAIHAIDSLRLAEEIDAQAARISRRIPVLLQINASEEPQKHGVAVGAAVHLAEQIATMANLQLAGVMTMAALDATEKTARSTFARTREIFEEIRWHKHGGPACKVLSMGMSNDFEFALLEGATHIRIGTTLFGTPPRESDDDLGDE